VQLPKRASALSVWLAKARTAFGLFIMGFSWNRTIRIVTENGIDLVIDVHTDAVIINLPNGDKARIDQDEIEVFADLLVIEK
jgi:hypothetical protein